MFLNVVLIRVYSTLSFQHWLVGMVYVFYFASFVILLREVLRPGVLWFLRNLNDPGKQFMKAKLVNKVFFNMKLRCITCCLLKLFLVFTKFECQSFCINLLPNLLKYVSNSTYLFWTSIQYNFENLFFRFQSHPGDDPSVDRASHASLLRVARHVRNVDPCDAVINFFNF